MKFLNYPLLTSADTGSHGVANKALKLTVRAARPLPFQGVQFQRGGVGKGRATRPAASRRRWADAGR